MKAHLQTQVQSKHDSLKGRICCRWNKTGGGDPARVGLGPNTEFGFEDLSGRVSCPDHPGDGITGFGH